MGGRTNFNFILKWHCTDGFSRQEFRCSATAKQADRELCTDDFSRQVNFILIFEEIKFNYL